MRTQHRQHIRLEIDDNLPLYYVHGAFGGANQAGELEVNIYSDSEDLPAPATIVMTQDGQTLTTDEDEVDREVTSIIRTVHSRFLLDADAARALASWLMNEADKLDGGVY